MSFFLEHLPNELILNIFEKYFENDSKLFDLNNVSSMVYFSLRTKQLFEKHLASKNVRNYLKYFTNTHHQFTIVNEIKFKSFTIDSLHKSHFSIDKNTHFVAQVQEVYNRFDWDTINRFFRNSHSSKCLLTIDTHQMQVEKKQLDEIMPTNWVSNDLKKIAHFISQIKIDCRHIIIGDFTIHFVISSPYRLIHKIVHNSTVYEFTLEDKFDIYLNSLQINGDLYIVTHVFNCRVNVYKISKNSSNDIFFAHFDLNCSASDTNDTCLNIKTSLVVKNNTEIYICMIFDEFCSVLALDLNDQKIDQIYHCKNGIFFIESKILNGIYLAKTDIISKVEKQWTENLSLTFIELKKNNTHTTDNFYSHKFIFDITINDYLSDNDIKYYNLKMNKHTILAGVNFKVAFNKECILIVCFDRILFLQLGVESPLYNYKTKQLISSFLKYEDFGNFSTTFVD